MGTERLTAFSDGVIAVIITIMVLDLRAPAAASLASLGEAWPVFASYVLSFVYVAIYWNNHHHLFALARRVSGSAMWANLHLLFWLSLIPFATSWLGTHPRAAVPTAVYGVPLLMSALAWAVLQRALVGAQGGGGSPLARALGRDAKGRLSPLLYAAAVALSFASTAIADAIYAAAALLWLVPDRRMERAVAEAERGAGESR